jgi:hypothetical protein
MDSPRIATAPAHSCAGSIVSILALARTRSAGPCVGESGAGCRTAEVADAAADRAERVSTGIAMQTPRTKTVGRKARDILKLRRGTRCHFICFPHALVSFVRRHCDKTRGVFVFGPPRLPFLKILGGWICVGWQGRILHHLRQGLEQSLVEHGVSRIHASLQ